ncbi:hypothetical protein KW796_02360 [Candidatus Parcubacteria bacterium]|nr:hypothetical protein [Candidatus Parcubacteria bacterium]
MDLGDGKVETDDAVFGKNENDFNIFALTDAIGAKDKRNAWMIYQRALASGMTADEIFWRVMWGVKSLLLAERCVSAEEAGLNPFVFRKSKSFIKNWKREELENLSESLTAGYHKARRGVFSLDSLLERLILSI